MSSRESTLRSVLVIDDDRDFADGMAGVLERLGYDVETIYAAADARAAMERKPIHIALIDLKLASDNGLTLIADLKRDWPQCLFILVTAFSSFDSVVQALQVGAYDYLQKPFSISALKVALGRAVDRLEADESRRAAQEELDRANANLRQINDRLQFLVSITQGLKGADTLTGLYPQLLDAFARSMGAGGGSLYLVHDDHLEQVCTIDDTPHAPARIPLPMPHNGVFASVLEQGEPVFVQNIRELPDIAPSGWEGYCDASVLAFPLRGSDGRTSAVLSLHSKDVPPFTRTDLDLGTILTGHVQESLRATEAFEALARSERKYRDLAEGSLQGIAVRAGSRFCFVNQAALDFYGARDLQEFSEIAEPYVSLFVESAPLATAEELESRGVPAGTAIARLVEIKLASGATRWIEAATKNIHWEGEPATLITGIDVTARVRAEERMRDQNRMLVQSEKMAALGTLVSGVAHEINNPVNLIGLNVALLERIWADLKPGVEESVSQSADDRIGGLPGPQIPETVERLIGGVSEAAQRIRHIVGRLRDFSQKQSADRFEAVDVNQVVRSTVELMRREISRYTAFLEVELAEGLPQVWGNRIDLSQVVVNLITNACQALTAKEQHVTIRTLVRAEDDTVVVEVQDEGRGIAPEQLPSIFDPFYTTKQAQGGTGLGLYVCYSIVREHEGRLDYSSEVGEGTRARLILPVSKQA